MQILELLEGTRAPSYRTFGPHVNHCLLAPPRGAVITD